MRVVETGDDARDHLGLGTPVKTQHSPWVEGGHFGDRSDVSSPTGQTVVGSRSGPGGDNSHADQGQQKERKEVTIVQMTLNLEPRSLLNQ